MEPKRVRSLVLVEPMIPTVLINRDHEAWVEVSSAYEHAHHLVDRGAHREAAQVLFEYILGAQEWNGLPEKVKTWMAETVQTTLTAHSRASLTLTTDARSYDKIKVPTLLLYGSLTRRPYQAIVHALSEQIEGSCTEVIEGGSHNSPLTHAKQVNDLIEVFLKK